MRDEHGIEAIGLDEAHYALDNFGFFGYIGNRRNTICQADARTIHLTRSAGGKAMTHF
jgi:hypothetical protein